MLKALGEKVTLTNRSPQGKISQEPSSGEAPERSLHASSPGNIHQAPSGEAPLLHVLKVLLLANCGSILKRA
tara:strand:- start:96 stop:311 length:216 start_codon:yes stop_codon:yes gene_type:complete